MPAPQSSIDQIFDAIFGELADLVPGSPDLSPGSPPLTKSYSATELDANGSPPRIVIFPTTALFKPVSAPGGLLRLPAVGNQRPGAADVPRPLRILYQTVEAHCWGQDRFTAERLLHRLVRGFYRQLHQSGEPTSVQWVTQQRPNWLNYGELVSATFEIQIPIVDATPTVTKVTSVPFDQTGASPTDGVLQAGEP